MSAGQHNDELLSGFLDGELNADERDQLNGLLESEPSLRVQLAGLERTRAELQAIPQRRLGPDFSQRVIMAARRQAMAEELPADHFVLAPMQATRVNRVASWKSPRKLAGRLAALAASIVLVTLAAKQMATPGPGELGPGELGPGKGQVVASSETQENQSADVAVTNSDVGLPAIESPFPSNLAASQPTTTGVNAADMGDAPRNGLPVRNAPLERASTQMLFIYDLRITQQAWDSNVLGSILENAGIRWSDPILADARVTTSLAKTRSIVRPDPAEELREDVALILVSAGARALDKAMVEIWQKTNDFPSTSLDIAFDLPGQDLVRNLSEAIGNADFSQTARPLVLISTAGASLEDVAQFSTTTKLISSDERRSAPSSASMDADDDAPSSALLVVRKPAQK